MADPRIRRAKRLRGSPTDSEQVLWQELRSRQVGGARFRRQHPIERFVVDFFCPEFRLVIEVDGDVHAFKRREDEARDAERRRRGFRVLRVPSVDVFESIDGVCMEIERAIESQRAAAFDGTQPPD